MNQVLVQFGDIEPFLVENSDVSPATQSKLLKILQTPQELIKLKVELAAVIDVRQHFVKSTYNLEGDGLLSLTCYEEILKIRSSIHSAYYPNVQAVIQSLLPESEAALQMQLTNYALQSVQPGIDYFNQHLGNDLLMPVAALIVIATAYLGNLRP